MSFSKAPIRRFNDPTMSMNTQKGKIQKSQSSVQKKTLHSPKNLKSSKDSPEQLTDLPPVEVEQPPSPKVQEYTNEFLKDLGQTLEKVPGLCEVGQDVITNRDSLVTWVSKLQKKYNIAASEIEALEHHVQEGVGLKTRWEEANKEVILLVKEVMQMCADKVLNLEKENSSLTELSKKLEVTSEEVKTLSGLKNALEEKLKRSDEMIKVLEQRLCEEEKKLKDVVQQNNSIEKQLKLKEQYNDLKVFEAQKSLDMYNNNSQNQVQGLEQRINELIGIVDKKESLIENLKQQLKASQDELSLRLQNERNSKAEEADKLLQAQQEMVRKDEQIETLSQDLCNLKQLLRRSEEQAASLSTQLRKLFNSGPDHQLLSLKKQVGDVRMSLAEVVHRNEELECVLSNKQYELEQKDKMIEEQRKVLRVRDELIGLLKGKEKRQEETITALQNALSGKNSKEK